MRYTRFYLYGFGLVCANSMAAMFLSLYLKSQTVGESGIGGLLSVYHLVMPVVIFIFGLLSDRVSCRRLVMLGSFISIIFCATMPHLRSIPLMAMEVALDGIGLTLSLISVSVLFLKVAPESGRGAPISIFVAAQNVGYAIGCATASLLIRQFSFPISIIFHAALPIHILNFIVASGLPDAPVSTFPIIKYFQDMNKFPVFCLALITFSLGMHWGTEKFSLVRIMTTQMKSSGIEMALFFIVIGATMAVFTRLAGHLMDKRRGFAAYLVFGMMLSGGMHFLTNWTRTFMPFLIVRTIHTCGDGFVTFAVPMLVSLAFASERLGGNYGFNRTINSIGAALGSALSGFLAARYNLGPPFLATGLFAMATAAAIWLTRRHLPAN